MQIHSKPESNDRCLQEKCGQFLGVEVIGVGERHTVDQPGQQSQRGRNEATGSYDKANKEDILGVLQAPSLAALTPACPSSNSYCSCERLIA